MAPVGIAVILAIGLVLLTLAVAAHAYRTLTHPPGRAFGWAVARGLPTTPADRIRETGERAGTGYDFESWTFTSRSREFPVWDVQGDDPDGPVTIISHGWAESRIAALVRLPIFAECSRRVILWDAAGHGDAPNPCTLGAHDDRDLESLIASVRAITDAPIVLAGSSLGAGVSVVVAARDPQISAVIADGLYRAPVTPAQGVMRATGMPWRITVPIAAAAIGLTNGQGLSWFSRKSATRFDRAAHAANLTQPLLVLHGDADVICPIEDAHAIAAAAGSTVTTVEGAGHIDLWTGRTTRPIVEEHIRSFFAILNTPARISPKPIHAPE